MSLQEDRLAALEQRVADIELECLYEKRIAAATAGTSSEYASDLKQVSHRMTMLLGIASGQETDIKSIKTDMGIIKEQIADIKQDNAAFSIKIDRLETQQIPRLSQEVRELHTKLDGLASRFDRLEQLLLDRLPPPSL